MSSKMVQRFYRAIKIHFSPSFDLKNVSKFLIDFSLCV